MVTNYTRSVLKILNQLDVERPKSLMQMYDAFGEEVLRLILGRESLESVIKNLYTHEYLTLDENGGYRLTAKGVRWKSKLTKDVADADQETTEANIGSRTPSYAP